MDRLRNIQISATPSASDVGEVYDVTLEKLKRLCTDKRRQRRDTHVAPTALMLRLTQRRLYDMHAEATSREERHHDDPRSDDVRETVIDCSDDDSDDDDDDVSGVDTERAFDDLVDAIVFSTHTLADDFDGRFEEDVYVHVDHSDVTAIARRNDAMNKSVTQQISTAGAIASRAVRRDVIGARGRKRLADTELVHDDAKRVKQTTTTAEHVCATSAPDVAAATSDVATPRCTDGGDGYDILATYYSR